MRKISMITLRALTLVVLLAGHASAGFATWTGGGPEGAAVRAVLIDSNWCMAFNYISTDHNTAR